MNKGQILKGTGKQRQCLGTAIKQTLFFGEQSNILQGYPHEGLTILLKKENESPGLDCSSKSSLI